MLSEIELSSFQIVVVQTNNKKLTTNIKDRDKLCDAVTKELKFIGHLFWCEQRTQSHYTYMY